MPDPEELLQSGADNPYVVVAAAGAIAISLTLVSLGWLQIKQLIISWRLRKPISILFLGHEGSGKTMLLVVAHRRMQFRNEEGVNFRVDDTEVEGRLNRDYRVLQGSSDVALSSTRGRPASLRDWPFVGTIREGHSENVIVRFRTADYPGELISTTLGGAVDDQRFWEEMRTTDAIFSLLDGSTIRMLMDATALGIPPDNELRARFESNFADLIQVMLRNPGVSHFVVTKWDALYGRYTLGQVVKFLHTLDEFKLIVVHQPGLRVIPISAVGYKYYNTTATPPWPRVDNPHIDPENHDVPFALAVMQSGRRRISPTRAPDYRAGLVRRMVGWIFVRTTIQLNLGLVALQWQMKNTPGQQVRVSSDIVAGRDLRNRRRAYQYLYARCQRRQIKLDRDFPDNEVHRFDFGRTQ